MNASIHPRHPRHLLFGLLALLAPTLAGCDEEPLPDEAEFEALDDELPVAGHEVAAATPAEAQSDDADPVGGHEILSSEAPLEPRLGEFCYSHATTCADFCACDRVVCQLECIPGIDPNFCNNCCTDNYNACMLDC
ncbi:hypothetical protein ACNOYE_29615 [Nannocystaceae bacterium ST9]